VDGHSMISDVDPPPRPTAVPAPDRRNLNTPKSG
jgi:hypothetical protein